MSDNFSRTFNKSQFRFIHPISTRWADNDIYGHVNNVTYYSYFDTAVNHYLISHCGLDIHQGNAIAYVVSSQCDYAHPVAFPDEIEVGVGVINMGRSSVTYKLAVFKEAEEQAVAHGEFVHVFVERHTGTSTEIPAGIRQNLKLLEIT